MLFTVRCHIAVMDGEAYSNVLLTYDGECQPSEMTHCDVVRGKVISVRQFMGETHSTVDYNGIAVIGQYPMDGLCLSLTDLRPVVERLTDISARNRDRGVHDRAEVISFYRLG